MRTLHRTWKTCALGAAAAAALLSSAACQPTKATAHSGAAPVRSGSPTAASPAPTRSGGSPAGTVSSQPSSSTGGTRSRPGTACTGADVSITASVSPHDEVRHLILTATNTSGRTCTLYYYPTVRFSGSDPVDRVTPMESQPKRAATLAPGRQAYAGIRLWRIDEPTDTVQSLIVGLVNRANTDAGKAVHVKLPPETDFLNVGADPAVTFWNLDSAAVWKFLNLAH